MYKEHFRTLAAVLALSLLLVNGGPAFATALVPDTTTSSNDIYIYNEIYVPVPVDTTGTAVIPSGTLTEMAEQAQEAGVDTLAIAIDAPADATAVSAVLPVADLLAVTESGVKSVKVDTPIADIEFDPMAIPPAGDYVTISAAQVDREALTAEQQSQVPENSIVVDLNLTVGTEQISEFMLPITVSIPYTLGENEDPDAVTVYLLKDDGTVEVISNGVYNPETGMVTFTTWHFSKYFARQAFNSYADLAADHWAYKVAGIIGARGLIADGDLFFEPKAAITEAEWRAAVNALLGEDYYTEPGDSNATLTRMQVISDLAKILGDKGYEAAADAALAERFVDIRLVSDEAKLEVATLVQHGLLAGRGGYLLAPNATTTRAEAAAFLFRLLKK